MKNKDQIEKYLQIALQIKAPQSPKEIKKAQKILKSQFDLFMKFWKAPKKKKIELRNEIALENVGLAKEAVRKTAFLLENSKDPSIDTDDLFQEAFIGLMRGVIGYDITTYETAFATYAFPLCLAASKRAVQNLNMLPLNIQARASSYVKHFNDFVSEFGRKPEIQEIADRMNLSVEKVQAIEETVLYLIHFSSLDAVIDDESKNTYLDFIPDKDYLPDMKVDEIILEEFLHRTLVFNIGNVRAVLIIQKKFGLGGYQEHTLEEIAQSLEISRERVRQIIDISLPKLRSKEVWKEAVHYFPNLICPSREEGVNYKLFKRLCSRFYITPEELINQKLDEKKDNILKKIIQKLIDHYRLNVVLVGSLLEMTPKDVLNHYFDFKLRKR